jgi:hypothetical protein
MNSLEIQQLKIQDLKLEKTWNTRDLGGYKTNDDKTAMTYVFVRSSSTAELNETDILILKNYSLSVVRE